MSVGQCQEPRRHNRQYAVLQRTCQQCVQGGTFPHTSPESHPEEYIGKTALTVASTMVGARLDYCNSVLYGASKSNLQKLQRVQNSLARIVTGTRRIEHITPVLARLHWLPIAKRVEYKVALLTFKVVTTQQPGYLNDLVKLHAPARQLRSSSRVNRLQVDTAKTQFASRAFCYAAPTVWNSLPSELTTDLSSINTFKSGLKTYLYRNAFRH